MKELLLSAFTLLVLIYATQGDECGQPADVAFVIDSSASIWIYDFEKQIDFVKRLVTMFDIGPNTTKVAAIIFADKIGHEFNFNDADNKEKILQMVGKISHAAGSQTLTHNALDFMRTDLFSPSNGAREGIPKICILLTDGSSTYPKETVIEAQKAKDAGIEIIAIGIGRSINAEELRLVVSPPASANFFNVSTFGDLESTDFQQLVNQQACKVIKTTTTSTTTTTTTAPTTTTDAITTTTETTTTTTEEATTPVPTTTTSEIPSTPIPTTAWPDEATTTCQGKEADVVLVVDMSTSIWKEDFKRQLRFLADVISHFDIESGKTRISMILFSDDASVLFYLDQYTTMEDITSAILSVQSEGGITNTHMALELMMNEVLTKKHGARSNVAHICILITDGRSRVPDLTLKAAERVHDSGVYVFAVGVGNMTDTTELVQMASDKEYAFDVKNGYGALNKIKNVLAYKTCEVPQGDQPRCANDLQANIVFGLYNIGGGARGYVSEFIKKVGGGFSLASGKVRVGLIESCGRAELQLQDFESSELYASAVVQSMATDMSGLLYNIRTKYVPSMFDKVNANTIIILLVSGPIHDMDKAMYEVMRLKHKNTIVAIGLDKSSDLNQLKLLASYKNQNSPDKTHSIQLNSPSELVDIIKQLHVLMCKSQ